MKNIKRNLIFIWYNFKKISVRLTMLIDFHTHAFPDTLAPRAIPSLQEKINVTPETDGTVSDLITKMDEWGVERAVVCNIATNPRQTTKVNDFALATLRDHGDRLVPLGSINPGFEMISEEIARLHKNGIRGLKIHPDYMEYEIDAPEFDEIFDVCAALGMFIITHAGFDVCSPNKIWATPEKIKKRLIRSPRTTLIGAHFGGNMLWDEFIDTLAGEDMYIDTSLCTVSKLPKDKAAKLLLSHSPDRILFGSDCPWCSARETYEYVDSLKIPDELKEKIYHTNAERLI